MIGTNTNLLIRRLILKKVKVWCYWEWYMIKQIIFAWM